MASGSSSRDVTNLGLGIILVKLSNQFTVDGQKVVLIDMPGFDYVTKSDVFEMIAAFLETQ